MKITLINTGKTEENHVREGFALYEKRLMHYCRFESICVNAAASSGRIKPETIRLSEAALILKKIKPVDYVVLLDEKGSQFRSIELASWLNQHLVRATRHLVFITGGAYGFDEGIYSRANDKIALSLLTFPHQLVRLIFAEQLYRAFSIIRNEPYHNE
jgi:23S rRNA (pseudouridine1915-N3)-methyltransferase